MQGTGKGSLTIRLTTADFARPIAGARIIITDMNGNLFDTVFTDISGMSPPVELPAPPVETQFDPNLTVRPYTPYIVDITANGFYETVIKGVQIYDESSSELPIDLTSNSPSQPGKVLEYDIGPNALEMYSTRQDSPPENLPAQQGPIEIRPLIHSEVFIPTHITVHLGTPTSSARNVTVRFVDYIKNVASSEIFPDWPYHSLRANIHAQISLALNRIFTEWYRSQGYSFDITNSTQYDQYFVENRNIFDSVGAIAEEIFNSYVIRPPGTEPYFTEYCNGTTSTCPGMKQWGTVTLAGQGKGYLEILRYYYGSNIYIATTDNIKTPFESFPGTLSIGSSGPNVSIIQSQLARIRQNFPKIPVVGVDGTYGTQTAAAVRMFQQVNGLSQTGTVDRVTWYKISFIYAAVKKLAELESEGQPPPPEVTPPPVTPPPSGSPPFPGTLLKIGSRGDDVRLMQTYLNALGTRYATIPQQTVDGIFGNNMHNAVVAFQRLFGLTADGIIGRLTWDRIVAEYNNLPAVPPSEVYPPFPGYLIRLGQQGENVRIMQRYLNAIGRVYPDIPQQTEDGIFGPTMYSAVVTFQKLYNLTADGIIGRNTWDKIVTVYNSLPSVNQQFPGILLRQGMQNDSIKLMQTYLNAIGRVNTQIPQLSADGIFGPMTHQAVLTFQRLFGLTADGVIGRITWDRIVQEYNNLSNRLILVQ